MPNWMSDEDLALSNGDARQCDDCGKVYSVDEWHTCPEGAERSRKSAREFNDAYLGDGTLKTRQFIVTVQALNTEMGFKAAWDDMAAWAPEQEKGFDEILRFGWEVEEIK